MIHDHPLKVYFPHGGKYFIAIWWTHDEQHQIVVAKSLSALENTLNIAINRNSDFEVKEMFEVDIVAPPVDFCQIKKEKLQKTKVIEFFNDVVWNISANLDGKKEQYPEIFEPCSKWKKKYSSFSKKEDTEHYYCDNCTSGIKLKSLSKDDFYQKYYDQYNQILPFPPREHVDSKVLYSNALPAKDLKNLWLAYPSFGHHARGVELMKAKAIQDCDMYACLFYFYKIKEIDNSKYKLLSEKLKEENKKTSRGSNK